MTTDPRSRPFLARADDAGPDLAQQLAAQVVEWGNPGDAEAKARFFIAGGRFVGVRVPLLRELARRHRRTTSLGDVENLLTHEVHEVRLLAAFLLNAVAARGRRGEADPAVALLLRDAERLDNWDLVDAVAPHTLGPWLVEQPDPMATLRPLAGSPDQWRRRLGMVATLSLIRAGDLQVALEVAELLIDDEADLVRKAVGWMLREVGQRDRALLDDFLTKHAAAMPRVALSHALEKHAPDERARFRALGRQRPTS